MANERFDAAKRNKADEFYTQLTDIEQELKHYKHHFKNKTVFCNCDDPYESNFFKYFAMNFNHLGLKKLIATSYDGSPILGSQLSIFDIGNVEGKDNKKPYKIVITSISDENSDGAFDLLDVDHLIKNKNNVLTLLKGNGDFRSNECVELLKEADIIVTNPPFSLFREYLDQLTDYDKRFIIIGNKNAITYKEVFKLIKENKLWTGYRGFSGGMWFYTKHNVKTKKNIGVDVLVNVPSIWFTNLDIKKRHENITLYEKYNAEKYFSYENYDAINVDKTSEIPSDWNGVMGVPITFLDKYNPDQFEIIALGIVGSVNFTKERKMEILDKQGNGTGKYTINAKGTLYRKYDSRKDKKPPAFKDAETGHLYSSIYARILIRKRRG